MAGRIISVQEQRFRLLTDEGQVYLLTLSRTNPLDGSDLRALHARQAHLIVGFDGEPNLASGVARSLEPA